MKIVSIVGARPQFVKAAVVSRAIARTGSIKEVIVHTGQHYDKNMSEVFFSEMDIPAPDYNLAVHGMTHGAMTGRMLEGIEQVLLQEHPDMVLVYGDTDSTLSGALAAVKLHIPLAHVEAGLRSFNMQMPEEVNRIVTDRISSILFCPTENAVRQLQKEGMENGFSKIVLCGDVMYDAALYYAGKARAPQENIPSNYILTTLHRAETTDNIQILLSVFAALEYISRHIMPIVLPLHPRTKSSLEAANYHFANSAITFMEPVGYFEMLYLINHAQMIMTDSGGLQKEAYFFKKKCLTLREQTEWVELLDCGCNVLCGTKQETIVQYAQSMLNKNVSFEQVLYGNGHAGEEIVKYLVQYGGF